MDRNYLQDVCVGFEQITNTDDAFQLTPPDQGGGVVLALIQAEAQGLRWRADGQAPTASIGSLIPANAELEFTGTPQGLAQLRLIAETTGAIANVHYFKNQQ
jgi:hypothetical protein